jgi:hypothetical protein
MPTIVTYTTASRQSAMPPTDRLAQPAEACCFSDMEDRDSLQDERWVFQYRAAGGLHGARDPPELPDTALAAELRQMATAFVGTCPICDEAEKGRPADAKPAR